MFYIHIRYTVVVDNRVLSVIEHPVPMSTVYRGMLLSIMFFER